MKICIGVTLKRCRQNLNFVRVVSRTNIHAVRALLNFYLLAIFNIFVRFAEDLQSMHLNKASFLKNRSCESHTEFKDGKEIWPFLGSLAKLRKVVISFITSVCLSVCPYGTAGRIFVKFDVRVFFEKLSR